MEPRTFRWKDRKNLAGYIKRAVASELAAKFREQPEAFEQLVELGLVDRDALAQLDRGEDFAAVVPSSAPGSRSLLPKSRRCWPRLVSGLSKCWPETRNRLCQGRRVTRH